MIVTENMFGDILSDEASEITGSIGTVSYTHLTGMHFTLVHYREHALDNDTDSRACCYVGLKWASGKETWGCGTHTDIIVAGIRALVRCV